MQLILHFSAREKRHSRCATIQGRVVTTTTWGEGQMTGGNDPPKDDRESTMHHSCGRGMEDIGKTKDN
jgi:hypothetical protein